MVRPANFGYNEETAKSNSFQSDASDLSRAEIQERALEEFNLLVKSLEEAGVNLCVVDDTEEPIKSDAIFPNNWITTHSNGAVITYPMLSESRRDERREDILSKIMNEFKIDRRYSLEHYEEKDQMLEGTGSMVLDRINKVVFACISSRTDPTIIDKFCALTGYSRVLFEAIDEDGISIYHTNVMMSVGDHFAVVCLDAVKTSEERDFLKNELLKTGRELIEINLQQMKSYAGNILQVLNNKGESILLMSRAAELAFTQEQKSTLEKYGKILSSNLDTIEFFGGGSARCMVAEIFTPSKSGDF